MNNKTDIFTRRSVDVFFKKNRRQFRWQTMFKKIQNLIINFNNQGRPTPLPPSIIINNAFRIVYAENKRI